MIPGIVAAQGVAAGGGGDPYWASVVSLLAFNGSPGGKTFIDEKGVQWAVTGGAVLAADPAASGGVAGDFPLTGGMLTGEPAGHGSLILGPFTIEGYVTPKSLPPANFFHGLVCSDSTVGTRGWLLTINGNAAGAFRFAAFSGSTAYSVTSLSPAVVGARTHVAVVRDADTLRLYVNGVLQQSLSLAGITLNTPGHPVFYGSLATGGAPSPQFGADGLLDDWRITTAVRYTGNFTPPGALAAA